MKDRQEDALKGRRVVVPESRELDRLSAMFERYGASVVRCPLVLVRPLENTADLDAWLQRLVGGSHDRLVFYTGEGVTHIVARAEQIGLRQEVVAALARVHKIARGPKPGAALRTIGLKADAVTEHHTSAGLLTLLARLPLQGKCVGVQLYPGGPTAMLGEALGRHGAEFDPVMPYRYGSDERDEEVAAVIQEMAAGRIDLIAFTSKLQVQRLTEVAERMNLRAELEQALNTTKIAAVGPVTAEAIGRVGAKVGIEPASNFHLKPFVTEIVRGIGRT